MLIQILSTIQLQAGGFMIVWRDVNSTIQHNTFTWDPAAWKQGFSEGKSLEELSRDITGK